MSREETSPLGANADDHPATASKPATSNSEPPLLGVHRFVMRPCDSAIDNGERLINEDESSPKSLIPIPDDINGSVTVNHNSKPVEYTFENGRLKSVSVKYGIETTA